MGAAGFLKHIPDAASSPLAFVAYCLVLAAWLARTWLFIQPQRHARQILAQFTDDRKRLTALTEVFHEQPPKGLTGNDAILEWARIKSSEKTKLLLVVAWLSTAVAVLLFLVAVSRAGSGAPRQISIRLHRLGTTDDCPSLPISTRLLVTGSKDFLDGARVTEGCRATLSVPTSTNGSASLALLDAGSYRLALPVATYQLGGDVWDVYVTSADTARLRLSLFDYSSAGCPDSRNAHQLFGDILRAKLLTLRAMFDAADRRYDYLSSLNLTPVGRPLDMSAQQVRDYWRETGSLQVLSGLCFSRRGAEIVRSQIFFGALGGQLPEPLLADLAVSTDEFGATRDVHTVSILYALARDASERHLDRDLAISYLARAREVAAQLPAASSRSLLTAIQTALTEMGAPQPMVL